MFSNVMEMIRYLWPHAKRHRGLNWLKIGDIFSVSPFLFNLINHLNCSIQLTNTITHDCKFYWMAVLVLVWWWVVFVYKHTYTCRVWATDSFVRLPKTDLCLDSWWWEYKPAKPLVFSIRLQSTSSVGGQCELGTEEVGCILWSQLYFRSNQTKQLDRKWSSKRKL